MKFRSTSKSENLRPYSSGHDISRPSIWRSGVIFASPHSGSIYPADLISRAKVTAHQLRRNEDIYIDHLFHSSVAAGAPFLKALFPRAVLDVNRAETELPDHWLPKIKGHPNPQPTPRAVAGLGIVPTHLSEVLPIYKKLPTLKDVQARIDQLYRPYHDALAGLVDEAKNRFGHVLLVDCHSMPGFTPMGARRPDIILGDRFGTSCHPDTLLQFRTLFEQSGYSVGVNYPYAGGYTTTFYGAPDEGVEAIQIEINRDLYVNPITLSPKSGYVKLTEDIKQITRDIVNAACPQNLAAQ